MDRIFRDRSIRVLRFTLIGEEVFRLDSSAACPSVTDGRSRQLIAQGGQETRTLDSLYHIERSDR